MLLLTSDTSCYRQSQVIHAKTLREEADRGGWRCRCGSAGKTQSAGSQWPRPQSLRALGSYLQRLEDGPAVGRQLGVGRLAEELGERGDGVQFVCRNLDKQTAASDAAPAPMLGLARPRSFPSLPFLPQRTCRLQTTGATSCRGWPAACWWLATSPRCPATRRSP